MLNEFGDTPKYSTVSAKSFYGDKEIFPVGVSGTNDMYRTFRAVFCAKLRIKA